MLKRDGGRRPLASDLADGEGVGHPVGETHDRALVGEAVALGAVRVHDQRVFGVSRLGVPDRAQFAIHAVRDRKRASLEVQRLAIEHPHGDWLAIDDAHERMAPDGLDRRFSHRDR